MRGRQGDGARPLALIAPSKFAKCLPFSAILLTSRARFKDTRFATGCNTFLGSGGLAWQQIGIGIVGGGYMGKAHAAAFASVGTIFETTSETSVYGDLRIQTRKRCAICNTAFGFTRRGAADWTDLGRRSRLSMLIVIASPQVYASRHCRGGTRAGQSRCCARKPLGLNAR